MTRVAIGSTGEGVAPAMVRTLALAGCEGVVRRGDRVLIKPNWNAVAAKGSTSLPVVEALCEWAWAQGAGEVVVGEGPVPVGPDRVRACFEAMDVTARLARVGARFVNFDEGEHELIRNGQDLPPEIGIAKLALAADVLINVPLLKVHSCCLATLCVKNLKGCLRPQDKMAFHRHGLLPAIVALNQRLRSTINVIDAIDAMEGDHNSGNLIHLGLLIAGCDRVAVDAVGCAQIGLDPEKVPLLRLAAAAGLGTHHLAEIELVGDLLQPRRFELVQDRLQRLYPDLRIDAAGACTACSAALIDGLFVAGGRRTVKAVALGAQAKPGAEALVLGKCLERYRDCRRHVAGCPPSGHAIAAALAGGTREEGG